MPTTLTYDSTIEDFTRQELSSLTNRYTKIVFDLDRNDPAFVQNFYRIIPEQALGAVRRDAHGVSATLVDVDTVVQSIATTPEMYDLLYGEYPNVLSGGQAVARWARKVDSLVRSRKIRQACSMVAEALNTMADKVILVADDGNRSSAESLAQRLHEFAERFSVGPDLTTGHILSVEESSWWGGDKELVWNDDETQFLGLRSTGFASIFEMVPA